MAQLCQGVSTFLIAQAESTFSFALLFLSCNVGESMPLRSMKLFCHSLSKTRYLWARKMALDPGGVLWGLRVFKQWDRKQICFGGAEKHRSAGIMLR